MTNTLSKQRLQTMLCLAFVASATLFISSCEKSSPVDIPVTTETEPKAKFDSVYFEIEGKSFSAKPEVGGMNAVGNGGYRKRYLEAPEDGMTIYDANGTGKKGWYAAADSIYFTFANDYIRSLDRPFSISFSWGLHKKDMTNYGSFYFPNDTRNLLKKGKLGFASDYESTNSKDGVAISFGNYGRTGKPRLAYEESLANYPQDDSVFEIINTEQIDKESYFVEAKFELNLYDKDRTKHRVTKGYIRLTLKSWSPFGYFYK